MTVKWVSRAQQRGGIEWAVVEEEQVIFLVRNLLRLTNTSVKWMLPNLTMSHFFPGWAAVEGRALSSLVGDLSWSNRGGWVKEEWHLKNQPNKQKTKCSWMPLKNPKCSWMSFPPRPWVNCSDTMDHGRTLLFSLSITYCILGGNISAFFPHSKKLLLQIIYTHAKK